MWQAIFFFFWSGELLLRVCLARLSCSCLKSQHSVLCPARVFVRVYSAFPRTALVLARPLSLRRSISHSLLHSHITCDGTKVAPITPCLLSSFLLYWLVTFVSSGSCLDQPMAGCDRLRFRPLRRKRARKQVRALVCRGRASAASGVAGADAVVERSPRRFCWACGHASGPGQQQVSFGLGWSVRGGAPEVAMAYIVFPSCGFQSCASGVFALAEAAGRRWRPCGGNSMHFLRSGRVLWSHGFSASACTEVIHQSD